MINSSLKFILTDCTTKDPKKIKKIGEFLSNGKFWQEEFGPQIFIGYNPFLNGRTKEIRGCGNNCVTCDFTNILNDLSYINNVSFDKISFLIQDMAEKANEDLRNIFKVNTLRFKIAGYPHLRISGGIQGDPPMTDEKTVYKLIKILNKNFPKAFISIDITANLRLLGLESLKSINDCGLNQINVSVNCSTEPAYAAFFNLGTQEAKKRFNIMKENIKNIDNILNYMNDYNTPIAKLGERVLMAKESDLSKIGTSEAMDLIVEQWNLETGIFEGENKLERLLKFNPWEDLVEANEIDEIKMKLKN
jgi:hypothetical protein